MKNKYIERLYNGIIKENPTLILMLGMCPTLAVSTRAMNGIGMGLSTTAVLIMSNLVISILRKTIPDEVRLPCYIVIVATMVTVTERTRSRESKRMAWSRYIFRMASFTRSTRKEMRSSKVFFVPMVNRTAAASFAQVRKLIA